MPEDRQLPPRLFTEDAFFIQKKLKTWLNYYLLGQQKRDAGSPWHEETFSNHHTPLSQGQKARRALFEGRFEKIALDANA